MTGDPKAADIDKIASNVKTSLESTIQGLKAFVESLEKSGFVRSLPAYKQLQYVLIQQRLWSQGQARNELQPLWEQVAQQSEYLYNIVKPFVEIMGELRLIDKSNSQVLTSESKEVRTEQQKMILDVLSKPHNLSAIRLSRLLNLEREALMDQLIPLVNSGVVTRKGRGRSASFRLANK